MTTNPGISTDPSDTDKLLREILRDVLGLSQERTEEFSEETGLFGNMPELDSMAVAGLLTEIEDRLCIIIEDEDVDGEMLETYGSLLEFTRRKQAESACQDFSK